MKNEKKAALTLALAGGLLVPLSALRADMVFLRDGRMLLGRVEAQSITTVTLVGEGGRQVLQKGTIIRIEYGDPAAQVEERRKRLAREAEIKKQRAESERLAEQKKKAEEEAARLQALQREAERRAAEAAEEEARTRAREEAHRLEEEQRRAAEEARVLEASKQAMDASTEKLQEENEVRTRTLTVRTGAYSMESAVLRNGSRLAYVGDANRIIRGGGSLTAVTDPGSVAIPFGAFRELRYETHRHRSRTGWVHTLGFLDSRGSPYVVAGRETAAGSVFDGTSNIPYSTQTESTELQRSPRLRELDYDVCWKVVPFAGEFLEHLHFVVGGGIAGSAMEAKNGWRQATTTGSLDPHALNPLYPSLGTLNTLSSNSYAEGIAYAHLGVGYVFPFLDIHAVDLRLLASGGKGAGYLNHVEQTVSTVGGQTVITESHARGTTRMSGRRLDLEGGYSITVYGVRVRLFGRMRQEALSVSSARIQTGNAAEKANAVVALASGGSPDFAPFLLERLENTGPYPEAGGVLRGVGIEVGAVF